MIYTIELLSDTLPGSGFEASVHIDSDVAVDESGIPLIPGKRIKGLLHESALEYLECMPVSAQDRVQELIDSLFGLPGKGAPKTIHVTDALWERQENLVQWLNFIQENDHQHALVGLCQPGLVTDHFTYIRHQTALENGVAKDHALRSMRVLKRGQKFTGSVVSRNGDFTREAKDLLSAAAANLRFLGMNRNRGFGQIAFKFHESKAEVTP